MNFKDLRLLGLCIWSGVSTAIILWFRAASSKDYGSY